MSASVVMIREQLRDQDEFDTYAAAARRARAGHPISPVIGHGAITTLEGDPADGILVNELPTVEDALAWDHGPAYQEAPPHRRSAADQRVLVVPGVEH